MAIFVIKEHWARSHHFDFRLEKDGVFKSWAVPKGLPEKPGFKRLAIQVEDHSLELGRFHEASPDGESERGASRSGIMERMSSKYGSRIGSPSPFMVFESPDSSACFVSKKANL